MPNWKHQARATADVSFGPTGEPKGATVDVDSYEYDDDFDTDEDDPDDEFRGGAHAILHFSFEDGTAVLDGIKDASSVAYHRWDFGPSVIRILPLGQRAVEDLPFVEDVELVDEQVEEQLSIGWEADWE